MPNTFHSRQDFINSIIHFQIPKIQIARMTGLDASRISEYLRKKPLPAATVEKIEGTVEQIVKVWSVLPVKVDLSDREGFARAVQIADDAIAKTNTRKLRMRLKVSSKKLNPDLRRCLATPQS